MSIVENLETSFNFANKSNIIDDIFLKFEMHPNKRKASGNVYKVIKSVLLLRIYKHGQNI